MLFLADFDWQKDKKKIENVIKHIIDELLNNLVECSPK